MIFAGEAGKGMLEPAESKKTIPLLP